MALGVLFGDKIAPACKYCRKGYPSGDDSFLLCSRQGSVSPEFRCRHFDYDPLIRIPKRPMHMEKIEENALTL